MKRAFLAWCLLVLTGCEDPLKVAQLLEEPRVLGARFVAAGDQSGLVPGEPATFEVLLAGPEGAPAARLGYRLCEAAGTERGVPYCEAESFAEGAVDLDASPIDLDVPAELPAGARVALLGMACLEGEPELPADPLDWSCGEGGAGLRFSFDGRSSSPDIDNKNPDLSELSLSIGGLAISPGTGTAGPACDDQTAVLAADTTHGVHFVLGERARESGEALQLSHFASSGRLERQYSFVAAEQTPEARLTWRAPAAGTALRHYLVVRDGRGGVSWLSFDLCAG